MAEIELKLKSKKEGNCTIIEIDGEIDANTSPALKEELDLIIAGGSFNLVCDCGRLSYISSAGIGVLNAALKSVKSKGGEIILTAVNKVVEDTLDLMYFTRKVSLLRNSLEAVKYFSSK